MLPGGPWFVIWSWGPKASAMAGPLVAKTTAAVVASRATSRISDERRGAMAAHPNPDARRRSSPADGPRLNRLATSELSLACEVGLVVEPSRQDEIKRAIEGQAVRARL